MVAPKLDTVQAYYDERVGGKLRDFTHANPRIEAAIKLIADWAPLYPRRILEIGCGIGATPWRMARAWPQAEVIGTDVSTSSIEIAKTCFQRSNLAYREGLIEQGELKGTFDLIVMMDVYEHIAAVDRKALHVALNSFLSEDSRLVLSFPTPSLQQHIREHFPQDLQPVEEDIDLAEIATLAKETATEVVYYRKTGIWRYGDYAHLVLARYRNLTNVKLREHVHPSRVVRIRRALKRLITGESNATDALHDYLGPDIFGPQIFSEHSRFNVSSLKRRRLSNRWFSQQQNNSNP